MSASPPEVSPRSQAAEGQSVPGELSLNHVGHDLGLQPSPFVGIVDAPVMVPGHTGYPTDAMMDPMNPALGNGENFLLPPSDEQLGSLVDSDVYDPLWFDLEPSTYYDNINHSCGFVPGAAIIDEVDRSDFMMTTETSGTTPASFSGIKSTTELTGTGSIWPPEGQAKTSAIITDEREHEMAYLIRHFTESVGPWMDLFDKDRHFGHLVPLKALRDALLRNAIAAVAAKQLGRVKGHKPFVGDQCQKPAAMEVFDDALEVDWFYKAANYYDKAIAFSRMYLQAISGCLGGDWQGAPDQQASSLAKSDDLLVAVSIFSLYESLDNREMGWLQHLAGLKSLLTAISAKSQEGGQLSPSISAGVKASFWNFARADYQAAYINRQQTYLDTDDFLLWRSCGLEAASEGSLYFDPAGVKGDPFHSRDIVQLVSHTVLWLVLRVTNYLAKGNTHSFLEQQQAWETLTKQLDTWYSTLPETFQPCAQMRHALTIRKHRDMPGSSLTEVFFSIEQCAAAIQLYHFARILLLVSKPQDQQGISRLKAYREVSAEAIRHARAIVSIALGRPGAAVRVEMLLPLFMAGRCLEADDERRVVLDVLKAIEKDTGCSTEVTARSLIDDWGWNQEPAGID